MPVVQERQLVLAVEEVEIPEEVAIPVRDYTPVQIQVKLRTLGDIPLHRPQIALMMNRRYETFIYPEWRNPRNPQGWSAKNYGNPPSRYHYIYYYYLGRMLEANTTYNHIITLLIGSQAKARRYGLHVSAGGYLQERCHLEDWLWTGWAKFYLKLVGGKE